MKRHPFVEAVLVLVVIGSMLGWALPAMADDVPTASDHRQANALYKEGVRQYNAGEYAGALDLFQNAFHRYPDPRILFSIATTLRQMGRSVDAANAYQRFVDDPHAEPQLVADTQTVLKVLDATVGKVEIGFDGPPGEIQIEDSEWMPAGTKTVRVEPGSFIVRGRRDGFTAETTGRVNAGATAPVTLTWKAIEAPKVVTPPPVVEKPKTIAPNQDQKSEVRSPKAEGRKKTGLIVAGGGIVLAAGAIVLELGARGKISDAESACPNLACADPSYSRAQDLLAQASSRRDAALVVGGVATIGVAVGAALWLTAHPSDTNLHVAPTAGDHTVGLVVGASF
jgi:tetratricopeptide (TPR) repeat protein